VAAQIDLIAHENVLYVAGMERVDERMLGFGQVDMVVALNSLIQERKPDQKDHREGDPQTQPSACRTYGFHRNTGLRAAVTSSTLLVRVL
jgi:hypothetical protein